MAFRGRPNPVPKCPGHHSLCRCQNLADGADADPQVLRDGVDRHLLLAEQLDRVDHLGRVPNTGSPQLLAFGPRPIQTGIDAFAVSSRSYSPRAEKIRNTLRPAGVAVLMACWWKERSTPASQLVQECQQVLEARDPGGTHPTPSPHQSRAAEPCGTIVGGATHSVPFAPDDAVVDASRNHRPARSPLPFSRSSSIGCRRFA